MGISRKRNRIFYEYLSAGIDSGIGRATGNGRWEAGDSRRAIEIAPTQTKPELRGVEEIKGDFNHPIYLGC